MIDEGSGGGGANVMQWAAALAAVLVTVSGAFIYEAPLVSSRPPTPLAIDHSSVGEETVPARLWQDPFKAVADFDEFSSKTTAQDDFRRSVAGNALHVTLQGFSVQAANSATKSASQAPPNSPLRALVDEELRDHLKLLVLPVMVPASPEGELAEQRLRVRVAVVEALMASGYEPDPDAKHIGAVQANWPKRVRQPRNSLLTDWLEPSAKTSDMSPTLSIPFERWRAMDGRPAGNHWREAPFDRVLVLWLDEEQLSDSPLARLALLAHQISGTPESTPQISQTTAQALQPSEQAPQLSEPVQIRVLGPRVSGTLHQMVVESQLADAKVHDALLHTTLYAATPTAADGILMSGADSMAKPSSASPCTVADQISTVVKCIRTTLTDDILAKSLAEELRLRRIAPDDHIAVISEWDSFYGRALGATFIAAAAQQRGLSAGELVRDPGEIPANFHPFHYLDGVDGQVAQGATDEKKDQGDVTPPAENRRGSPKYESAPEQPEGLNQADYLRRLADQLGRLDDSLQRREGKRLAAVGILGTDLYDKILILRAIRDRLPNVVLFTTSLDSRYALPSEWAAAHNLIIAAPFGLRLHEFYQQGSAPFRDSDQTAVFHGILCAVWDGKWERIGSDDKHPLYGRQALGATRLFEIGRGGPVDLTVEDEENPDKAGKDDTARTKPPTVHPLRDDVLGIPKRWCLWTFCLVVLLLLCGALVRFAPRPVIRQLGFAGGVSIVLLLILCIFSIADGEKGEPAVWIGRVNVWPGEFIRLLEVIICCGLVVGSLRAVKKTDDSIGKMFDFKPFAAPSWKDQLRHPYQFFSDSFRGLYHLFEECEECQDRPEEEVAAWDLPHTKSKIDVQNLWDQYRSLASPAPRLARLLTLGVLLGLLALALQFLLPSPPSPTRGFWAYWINEILVVLMAGTGIGLTVFVFDGAILNAGLISSLIRSDGYPYFPIGTFDRWPWPKVAGHRYDLTEVLAITLIVRRTRVAATAIYFPFIIFLLVLLGRAPVFADWRWSSSLVILTGVCFSLTLAAAVILKRAAELARRTSAGMIRLRALRYSNFGKPDSKAAMEQLADYVENENRGAFSRVLPTMIFFIITLFGWGVIDYFTRYISP